MFKVVKMSPVVEETLLNNFDRSQGARGVLNE